MALALLPYTETSRTWFKNMQLNKKDRGKEKVYGVRSNITAEDPTPNTDL